MLPQGYDAHHRDEDQKPEEITDALEFFDSVRHDNRANERHPDGRCGQHEVAEPAPETGSRAGK